MARQRSNMTPRWCQQRKANSLIQRTENRTAFGWPPSPLHFVAHLRRTYRQNVLNILVILSFRRCAKLVDVVGFSAISRFLRRPCGEGSSREEADFRAQDADFRAQHVASFMFDEPAFVRIFGKTRCPKF